MLADTITRLRSAERPLELSVVLLTAFVAGAITDLATGLGVLPLIFVRRPSERVAGTFMAGAAGMMVAASLVQLVGEALHRSSWIGGADVCLGLAIGAVFFAVATQVIERNELLDFCKLRATGGKTALLVVLAMTIHSLPEGVAVGVGYGSEEATLGLAVALAIAVHNVPEGLAIALALRPGGVSLRACFGWAVFSSLPQPIAAVPAAWAVWLFKPYLPAAMGFAAGAMLFLVVSDLLPDGTRQAGKTLASAGFVVGVVLMVLLGQGVGLG